MHTLLLLWILYLFFFLAPLYMNFCITTLSVNKSWSTWDLNTMFRMVSIHTWAFLFTKYLAQDNKSFAVSDMAVQYCTNRIVKRWGWASFRTKLGEKRVSAVMYHVMPKTRIFQLDFCHRYYGSSFSLILLAPKPTTLGEMT